MPNLMEAHTQWATRPDDERFLSLESLLEAVSARKDESWTCDVDPTKLRVVSNQGRVGLTAPPQFGQMPHEAPLLDTTHWSFGQLAGYAGAPAAYLRKLPDQLAAINLQWGLEHIPARDSALMLGQSNGSSSLRSLTSTKYGRIWDAEVVQAVINANAHGNWKVPSSTYDREDPLRATTLYASDRDVWMFLVDPDHPIEIGDEVLYRGFFAWNSEVGSQTFGLSTFLYRVVCDNRIVWGAQNVNELRVRHTRGAPERFQSEGQRYLEQYAGASADDTIQAIKAAQSWELPRTDYEPGKRDEGWSSWLAHRGFTRTQARAAVTTAQAEQGEARSLWDIIQGVTAHARSVPNTDTRVDLERQGGKLMRFAEAKTTR